MRVMQESTITAMLTLHTGVTSSLVSESLMVSISLTRLSSTASEMLVQFQKAISLSMIFFWDRLYFGGTEISISPLSLLQPWLSGPYCSILATGS